MMLSWAGNFWAEDEELIWKLGGGSSKLGRVGAPGLREFSGCWAFSASSAVPIPGGGIAMAARLAEGSFGYGTLSPPKAQYRPPGRPPDASGGSRGGGISKIAKEAIF
jgi:hypothetical protein